jgi:hypothetical protein
MKTHLIVHSVYTGDCPNLRIWVPDDPANIAEFIAVNIGHRSKKSGSDTFSIRVATPLGLMGLEACKGIIAARPLLVMEEYSYNDLWAWVESIIELCDSPNWQECVDKLRMYFEWEYENYVEA